MENNRNWQGWAAVILAGLALFVALGGRGFASLSIGNDDTYRAVAINKTVAPVDQGSAPAPVAPPAVVKPDVPPAPPAPVPPAFSKGFHMPNMGTTGMTGPRAFFQHGLSVFGGLVRLVMFLVLGALLFRFIRRRQFSYAARSAPPGPPSGPPPPAGPPPADPNQTRAL